MVIIEIKTKFWFLDGEFCMIFYLNKDENVHRYESKTGKERERP